MQKHTTTSGNTMLKASIITALMAMQYHWMASAMAMYQLPLLSTTVSVAPNFILTLDNSESMALHHLPENAATVNGYTVYMGGTHIVLLHPDDIKAHPDYNFLKNAAGTVPASTTASCATPYECQMRSPDVNSIYYNPANLYKPWPLASDPSKRMPAASYTAAYFDPLTPTSGYADLSKVNTVGVSAVWCSSAGAGGVNCDRNQTIETFNPAIFYRLIDEKRDPNLITSYVKYDLNDATRPIPWGKNLYTARTDCAASCTLAQEQQNFANWFTYYRSRILLTKGTVSETFASVGDNIRLGWTFTYNAQYENIANPTEATDTGKYLGGPIQGVLPFTAENRVKFLTSIQNRTVRGSTPLRYATAGVGEYFKRTDSWSPWRKKPGAGTDAISNPILGCRRAAHIMTTDGYYNDNGSPDYPSSKLAVGEVDNITKTLNGITYTPSSPYKDGNNSNSLADIAMYYWAFPLLKSTDQSSANDKVPAKPTDPATWLHLNQYMVGLGVNGTITTPPSTTNPPANYVWPTIPTSASDNTSPTKIDDMLHATLNSHGKFFVATESTSLKNAMIEAINSGQPEPASESGVATSGNTAVEGDLVFTPSYQSQIWTGDITAYKLTQTPGIPALNRTELWRASDRLPAPGLRNIAGYSSKDSQAIAFKAENVDSFATIAADYRLARFIDFIRGVDDDQEPPYRHRTGKLPDFINSTPLLIGGNLDMGYQTAGLPSGGSTYGAFVADKKARVPMLFMGGNGGMLHAFNATDSASRGIETFAYIPKGVMTNLHLLAQPVYNHHFYVDGPLTEADAYLPDGNQGNAWQNIVIGTLGAGGKGVFAIRVPVGAGQPTLGASQVMWDLDETNDDAGTLGNVTSPVQVGYVQNNGGWYAFIGNGHDSAGGTASLIVVDLATGKVARAFKLDAAAAVTTPNGLSGVDLIKNAKGEVIGAYAGDLHGQLWRFEFDGSDTSAWKIGFSGKPLFAARDANGGVQRISAAPSHFNLASKGGSGNLVLFGTGRLTEKADTSDSNTQTFYGVLDETVGTSSAGTSPFDSPTAPARSLLQEQTFLPTEAGQTLIRMSSKQVPLTGDNKKLGWYVDLDFSSSTVPSLPAGQTQHPKVIFEPMVIRSLVFFTAIQPPLSEESCTESKSYNYTFLLPVLTGGQAKSYTWDSNGDGVFNSQDEKGQGFLTSGRGVRDRIRYTNEKDIGRDISSGGDMKNRLCAGDESECNDDPVGTKRISDRVWKRIIKPPF